MKQGRCPNLPDALSYLILPYMYHFLLLLPPPPPPYKYLLWSIIDQLGVRSVCIDSS